MINAKEAKFETEFRTLLNKIEDLLDAEIKTAIGNGLYSVIVVIPDETAELITEEVKAGIIKEVKALGYTITIDDTEYKKSMTNYQISISWRGYDLLEASAKRVK